MWEQYETAARGLPKSLFDHLGAALGGNTAENGYVRKIQHAQTVVFDYTPGDDTLYQLALTVVADGVGHTDIIVAIPNHGQAARLSFEPNTFLHGGYVAMKLGSAEATGWAIAGVVHRAIEVVYDVVVVGR